MKLSLHEFELPLKHPFTIARGTITSQLTLVVELNQDGESGFGEAPVNTFYAASLVEMKKRFADIQSLVLEYRLIDPVEFWSVCSKHLSDAPFMLSALDCAAHDLWGKLEGAPVHQLWGLDLNKAVCSSFTIGIDTIDIMRSKLKEEPGWPVIWMRGNHEDFDYLSSFRKPTAVDPWQRLIFLPDGQQMTHAGVRIGAMGGMAPRQEHRGHGKTARKRFRDEQKSHDPRLVPRRLIQTSFVDEVPDILLTHAGPKVPGLSGGSVLLGELSRRIRPTVHFFGHHHVAMDPTPGPGGSTLIGLDHVEFRRGHLQSRCWGILEIAGTTVRWTWGDGCTWTEPLTRKNYRHILGAALR